MAQPHLHLQEYHVTAFPSTYARDAQGQPGTWIWIGVEDAAALFEEYKARGATIRQEPTNYSWAYEMRVEDPDGHVLRIGSEPMEGEPSKD